MKRSNGEGTIFRRKDGRWCAAYYDESPNPKRHFVYGATQKEVKEKLKEKKERQSEENRKNIYTLEEWLLYFLENYKKNELKESTYSTYIEMYRKHIKGSEIAGIKLDKLTANQLQGYYNRKTTEGYNAKTVKHMHVLINSALEKGVQLKFVRENVGRMVILPKKKLYEAKVLSASEVSKILKEAKEDELYPIIVLTIYTGLRKGEVMALKWENVNLAKREIKIEKSLCRVIKEIGDEGKKHYEYKLMEPKTEKSKRTIPLMDMAIEALNLQKQRQDKLKEKYKTIYKDEGFVFARYDGRYLNQREFMNSYHDFLKKYGITDIRFHDLRHTFASLLLEAGESPKVIQELLGHSTITTTMDIYAHITKQGKENAVQKLEQLLQTK